jgi:L-lactate dehydrogenase complex protein LldG
MSSREKILAAVRRNQPAARPLPEIPAFESTVDDPVSAYRIAVEQNAGQCRLLDNPGQVSEILRELLPDFTTVLSRVPGIAGTVSLEQFPAPVELAAVDVAILPVQLGVVENGAAWLDEAACGRRVLPFITQHLVLVLDRTALVPNMHEAYARIDPAATGFGVFIAGPSKTADIEQSLVIGAQGPRSLTVLLS